MNIAIKKMETDDEIKGRAFVAWHSWRVAYKGIVNQDYLDGMKLEKVEEIAFKFKDGVYVAKDGEKVVGFVSMVFDVTNNKVYWCENRDWDSIHLLAL